MAFNLNSSLALTGSHDGSVKLIDLSSVKEIKNFEHKVPIRALCFSKLNDQVITLGDDKIIRIWKISTFEKTEEFPVLGHQSDYTKAGLGNKYITSAKFNSNGENILIGCHDKKIYFLPVIPDAKSRRLIGHSLPVCGVGFLKEETNAFSYDQDSTLRLWDLKISKEIQCIKESDLILRVTVSRNGQNAITRLANGKVHVWNLLKGCRTFFKVPRLLKQKNYVSSFIFNQDNRKIMCGSFDGFIYLWDFEQDKILASEKAYNSEVFNIELSHDGSKALTCDNKEYIIKLWEINC
jgi:centriolar protein POC1